MVRDGLVKRAQRIMEEEGVGELARRGLLFILIRVGSKGGWAYQKFIRPILPNSGHFTRNGIEIAHQKPLDKIWDDKRWHGHSPSKGEYKTGNNDCIQRQVQKGDKVVVIGGGYGVTSIQAAEIVGDDGCVIIFEGSKKQTEYIDFAIRANQVEDICSIRHAIVGSNISVYEGMGNPDTLHPTDLPECDVLEMDCEGAEFTILKEMHITPRELIIEIHPHRFEENPYDLLMNIKNRGYEIVGFVDQEGTELTESEADELLTHSRNGQGRVTASGTVHPPIVCATRST